MSIELARGVDAATAQLGIPLVAVAVLLLALVDLRPGSRRRRRIPLLIAAGATLAAVAAVLVVRIAGLT